ncbi:MAG TPA: GNAT family N-acetyltransferase [Bacteroidia bacterium]|jgi:L-amino acid N-acyltransferase YncA|nr:GNAT family N-acetyltransferase [Bacteroidia bacterium]
MIAIRIAEDKDLPEILEIYNYAILHTTSVYSYKPHTLDMRKKWLEEKRAANHPVFVAETGGKIVGFIAYGPFRAWPGYKYTVEHSVHIHKDFRRQGIARILLAKLIEAAKENNVHAILGAIDADNHASVKLHEQFGFREVGHLKEVGYKFNKWLDLVFYELVLETPAEPVGE